MTDLLLHNLRTIGTHHCDGEVGKEAADEIERLRAELAAEQERADRAEAELSDTQLLHDIANTGLSFANLEIDTLRAELAALRAERVITASPWRYQEWGGLVVGGGEGSAEVLICTMATNTRHDEGRRNRELIVEAPTLRARLDKAEAERDVALVAVKAMHKLLDRDWAIVDRDITLRCESHDQAWNYLHEMRDLVRAALGER